MSQLKPDSSPFTAAYLKAAAIGAIAAAVFYFGVVLGIFAHAPITKGTYFGRVMTDPINFLSFLAFAIAVAFLIARRNTLRRQMRYLAQNGLIPHEEQLLLLPSDGVMLRNKFKQLPPHETAMIPAQLLDAALQRVRVVWSAQDATEAVKTKAELLQVANDAEFASLRYLAWAIPSIGFIGTVYGLGRAIEQFLPTSGDAIDPMQRAVGFLFTAFDTTMVALILSLILMLFLMWQQAAEDAFLVRSADWCFRRFVFQLHSTPEPRS